MSTDPNDPMISLNESECLALLRRADIGRLAVVVNHRPEIFPITYIVDHATIVFRTAVGTKLEGSLGRDVAFEVDGYEPHTGEAWSVIAKGPAREIKQMSEALEALELPLYPWHAGPKPRIMRIEPETITGRRFQIAHPPARHPSHEG